MTEEPEEGPDPNDLRRHAKRMFTEREYRQRYRRLDFYKPNRKQLEFHNLAASERLLRAGNQEGKTHSAGAELAMHACQIYPAWHKGRKFSQKLPIERPFDFLGWAGSTTSSATRDGIQIKLLGDIREKDGLGTGLIPLDNLTGGRIGMARGIDAFVDTINLTREDGGKAVIRQKTGEMERRAWQGEAVDVAWLDEDFGDDSVYGEVLARLVTTNGIVMVTMTPMLGTTPIRKRFKEKHPGTAEVLMGLDDALVSNGGHIPDEAVPAIKARYKESERQTRLYGADMQGEGAVFETPIERIKQNFNYREFPDSWRWLWGLDFRHSGNASGGHPFAAVLGCHSGTDGDVIHIVEAFKMFGLAETHVRRIKEHRYWRAPCTFGHDGGRGASLVDGETIAQLYRRLGLNMLDSHATFQSGGYNFEAGITELENRFATGRLVVAQHLSAFFDEYQGFHRINGQVHKVDDDLLSATRFLCMQIRSAKRPESFEGFGGNPLARPANLRFARGTAGHPEGSFDVFSGKMP
jgi:phage terminase large subunit-like protein